MDLYIYNFLSHFKEIVKKTELILYIKAPTYLTYYMTLYTMTCVFFSKIYLIVIVTVKYVDLSTGIHTLYY